MAKKTQMERIEEFNESKVLSCDCPFPKGIRSWNGSSSNEWFMDAITDPEAYAYQNLENRLVDRRGRRAEKHSHVVRAVKELLQEADDIFEPSIQFYSGVAQLTPEIVAITRKASGQSNNNYGYRRTPRYTWTLHSKLPPKTANLKYDYNGSEDKRGWKTHEGAMNIPAWWLNPSKKVRGVAEWLDVYSLRRVSITKILTAKAEYYMALQMFMIPNGRLYEMRREQCLYGGDFTREAIDEIVEENNGLGGHYWEVKGKAGMVKREGEHYPLSYYRSHQTYSRRPEERGWLAGLPLWSIPCDDTPILAPTSEQALLLVRAELREMRGKYNAICADIKGYEEIIPTLEKEAKEMAAEMKLMAVKIA